MLKAVRLGDNSYMEDVSIVQKKEGRPVYLERAEGGLYDCPGCAADCA